MRNQITNYSANNPYASRYYNALNNFNDIRSKVIEYERSTPDRESTKYINMMEKFTFWDKQAPLLSQKASLYETTLAQRQESQQQNGVGVFTNYLA